LDDKSARPAEDVPAPSADAGLAGHLADADLPEFLLAFRADTDSRKPDTLKNRFRIKINSPLPSLDSSISKAYDAVDEDGEFSNLYALICNNHMPYRKNAISASQKLISQHYTLCRAAGPVLLSHLNETRLVLFLDRPQGRNLRDLLQETGAGLSDQFVIERVLRPLHEVLSQLHNQNIAHGCINPAKLYFADHIMLGECVSEPCGFSQDYFYEPPDRLVTLPTGRGPCDTAADCYALGILTIYLLIGRLPVPPHQPSELAHFLLQQGSYNAFTHDLELPTTVYDLLRGTLNDNRHDRWGMTQINAWLGGKRYNLIPPSIPRDSTRSFNFGDKDYGNRRALAHALFTDWEMATRKLAGEKLVRWIELSAGEQDLATLMANALHISEERPTTKEIKDEDLGKAIAILDPNGPVRFKSIAVTIEGMGIALANFVREKENATLQTLLNVISGTLPNFINTVPGRAENIEAVQMMWKFQRVKMTLRIHGLGFGLERILYDLNETLPCQSPLLLKYHILTLKDALFTLEMIAKDAMRSHTLADRHLAAFIASKLDVSRELRVKELAGFSEFIREPNLLMLKLLEQAQKEAKIPVLRNLTLWVAHSLTPVIEQIKSKHTRENIAEQIKKAAVNGKLSSLSKIICDDIMIGKDMRDYYRAQQLHRYHKKKISDYQDGNKTEARAKYYGRQLSVTLGYIVLGASIFLMVVPYINF
jgi:eukaryotic-like serine/threonine-protein kinase